MALYSGTTTNIQDLRNEVEHFCSRILNPIIPQSSLSPIDMLCLETNPLELSNDDKGILTYIIGQFLSLGVQKILEEGLSDLLRKCLSILEQIKFPTPESEAQFQARLVTFDLNLNGLKRASHAEDSSSPSLSLTKSALKSKIQTITDEYAQHAKALEELKVREASLKAELVTVSENIVKEEAKMKDLEVLASRGRIEVGQLMTKAKSQNKLEVLREKTNKTLRKLYNLISEL